MTNGAGRAILSPPVVVECEVGGGFQIGWQDDAPGHSRPERLPSASRVLLIVPGAHIAGASERRRPDRVHQPRADDEQV
jgi:hypothetical protein